MQAAAGEEVAEGRAEAGERGLAHNGLCQAACSRHRRGVGHRARHRGLRGSAQALHHTAIINPSSKDEVCVGYSPTVGT